MENGIMFLADKLSEIYYIYEFYAWHNENSKIYILIEDEMLNIALIKDDEIIDKYTISFNGYEHKIFEFLALSLFETALGYVVIHQDGYKFENKVHKPYLDFVITEEKVLNVATKLADKQNEKHIHEGIEDIYPTIPFSPLNKECFNHFEERTYITKQRLKESKK